MFKTHDQRYYQKVKNRYVNVTPANGRKRRPSKPTPTEGPITQRLSRHLTGLYVMLVKVCILYTSRLSRLTPIPLTTARYALSE